MAGPAIKVFDAYGKYQAACKDYAAAACLMGLYGEGATVRLGHGKRDIVWTEGETGVGGDNFDAVGEAIRAEELRRSKALDAFLDG